VIRRSSKPAPNGRIAAGLDTTAQTFTVRTLDELQAVLDDPPDAFVLVEAMIDKDDAPPLLIRSGLGLADQDFGPRGPQSEPGAQIPLPAANVPEAVR
jgi:hypothetical protein